MKHTEKIYRLVLDEYEPAPMSNCLKCPIHCGQGAKRKRKKKTKKNIFSFKPEALSEEKAPEDMGKHVEEVINVDTVEVVEVVEPEYESEDEVDPCCRKGTINHPDPVTPKIGVKLVCKTCGFKTKSFITLKIHKKNHKETKDNCKTCSKSFANEKSVSVHFLEEHTKRKCTDCQKSFTNAHILKAHRKKHFKQK